MAQTHERQMVGTSENIRVIDLGAIASNVRAIRARVPESAMLMAVVKADGYGHGAVQVSRTALAAGAEWLSVARAAEGASLRRAGITAPILILGAPSPAECREAARHLLTLTVCTPDHVRWAAEAARSAGIAVDCHLKLDTGMGRIGARSEAEVRAVLDALDAEPAVRLTGVFTHFADADGADMTGALEQLRLFREMTAPLPAHLIRHCANSAAIHRMMPEAAFDMVRMGVSLYGFPPVETDCPLRPAMSWLASVTHVKTVEPGAAISYGCTWRAERPTRVATITCGYGDGYHRSASGKAQVLLHGKRVPVIGRICMDQMMADVTEVPGTVPGDTVTLMGRDGDEVITADELASWAGTISYEVLLSAQERVGRTWIPAK